MLRAAGVWVLTTAFWCLPSSAQAYCRSYIEADSAGMLRYSYSCENTYSAPEYRIIHQYIGENEQAFFEFAPKEIGLLCSSGLFSGQRFDDCHTYTPNALPETFNGGIGIVNLYPLGSVTSYNFLSERYTGANLFRYPDLSELVQQSGCAVTVSRDRTLDLFFLQGRPELLAECLLQFELYATENWRDLIKR